MFASAVRFAGSRQIYAGCTLRVQSRGRVWQSYLLLYIGRPGLCSPRCSLVTTLELLPKLDGKAIVDLKDKK